MSRRACGRRWRKLEAIRLLGWIYRGQYQEERRKSQRIPEPGQFIVRSHETVINNCHESSGCADDSTA
jgi:hypothetical protein